MSVGTRVAALEMQLRELKCTPCARCGHRYASHSLVTRPACRMWSHEKDCRCKGFVDPGEKLALSG